MLSSNSSSCNQNPNYLPFFENETTSLTSNLIQDPNFFTYFPNSPHLHFDHDDVAYLQPWFDHFHHHQSAPVHPGLDASNPAAVAGSLPATAVSNSKRDRHSKIDTARGPRDRRMRLSLDIARKFFDLQDMLGHDKASRTVDWLLRSSSSAIGELELRSSSSAIGELELRSRGVCNNSESCSTTTTTRTSAKKVRKRGVQQKRAIVARESRRKARERARERTSQKRRLMRENTNHLSSDFSQPTTHDELVFSWNAGFLEDEQNIAEFQCNGKPWQAYNNFNVPGSASSF